MIDKGNSLNVTYYFGQGLKNRRCAMCRTEFPLEFLERPQLLIPIASTSASHSEQNEYQWFYKGRNGLLKSFTNYINFAQQSRTQINSIIFFSLGWWQYDERTCQEIEDAYKNGQKQCTILVAGYVYIVDFVQMLQQRQSDPLRKRQVKRDLATIPKKGVAGLRLWYERNLVHIQLKLVNSLIHDNIKPNCFDLSFVCRCTDDSTQNVDGTENPNANSNFISTIAATERVIRIASDIIDSTLAHADDQNEQRNDTSGQPILVSSNGINNSNDVMDAEQVDDGLNSSQLSSSSSSSNSSNFNSSYNRRDMLDEIEETFNITNLSSINNSFRSTQLDDFFSVTLDEFRNLTMNNIADDSSSSDENNEDEDNTISQ